MNLPIPTFLRQPVSERDQTIMRPSNDDFCIQLPSSDYLIPISGPRSVAERLLSEATCVTLSESVTTSTAPKICTSGAPTRMLNGSRCWETSFSIPSSSSEQLLLPPEELNHINKLQIDSPQHTPITLKPPVSFSDMEDGLQSTITLDPAALEKQSIPLSYANVRVANIPGTEIQDKGTVNGNTALDMPTPFTIQGFNDRYIPAENHSEISC